MINIKKTIDNKMCCGCGACNSICPNNCIEFIEGKYVNYPQVVEDNCIECGLCLKVCPGEINSQRLIKHNKVSIESNIKEIMVGYSTDIELRKKSASGGMITQIIKSMFEEGTIDGAIVVTQNNDKVIFNKVKIVDNINDLLNSQGSRYSPASNCLSLKEIIKNDKYKNIIVVGKPCDIEAVSRFENLNSKLKEKIVIKIAIMCHHSPTRKGILEFIKSKQIRIEEIDKINYRGNGWPGNFTIVKNDGSEYSTSYFDIWNNYLCKDINQKCNYCDNPFPLEADIIIGDPWGEEFKNENIGQSIMIIRNDKMLNIINRIKIKKQIEIQKSSYDDVKRFQKNLLMRYYDFNLISLIYKSIHNEKINIKDYINLIKNNPKNILRYIKRIKSYRKDFNEWSYK